MADIFHRPRRLRRTENLRALVRETRLAPEDFILPLFACAGEKVRREIPSMPGVHNLSVDEIANEAAAAAQLGVKGVMLFGLPETKDEFGSGAYHQKGIVQQAVRSTKRSLAGVVGPHCGESG
jgi:porphobilinogen synthase